MSILKRTLRAAVLATPLLGSVSWALPGNLVAGNQLATGAVTVPFATPTLANNPALLSRALAGNRIQVNGLRLPAFALELGDVEEDFVDRLDELEAQIDCAEDEARQQEERMACVDTINGDLGQRIIGDLADAARVNVDVALPVPGLPVVFRALGGQFAVNVEAAANVGVRVLNSHTSASIDPVSGEIEVNDDTAAYLKSGLFTQFGVGYSRKMMDLRIEPVSLDGELFVGGRLNLINGKLSRQIAVADDGGDDDSAFDRVGDNYDLNAVSSTAVGLDLGVGVLSSNYSIGLVARNFLPPAFDFSALGEGCGQFEGSQLKDCQSATYYTDPDSGYGGPTISANERYKLNTQFMLEGSYDLGVTGFTLLSSLELNPAENIAGDEYQWLHLGLAYHGPWLIPAMRIGYRSNLGSDGLDVYTLSFNLFRFLTVEAFQADETAEFDGDKYPRAVGVSLGFSGRF